MSHTFLFLIFSLFIVDVFFIVGTTATAKQECKVRQYNFTAVQKDASGKRCRDKIQSVACFGACETLEYGTEKFPHKAGVQTACQHDKFVEKTIELKFCEPGVSEDTKIFSYTDALSCKCESCKGSTTKCISGLETRKKKSYSYQSKFYKKNDEPLPTTWEDIKTSVLESEN